MRLAIAILGFVILMVGSQSTSIAQPRPIPPAPVRLLNLMPCRLLPFHRPKPIRSPRAGSPSGPVILSRARRKGSHVYVPERL
jgi:hypothetical protein